jgi:hypothetical protein
MSTPSRMAYVAIAACGCTKMAAVDRPEYAEENASRIAACIRDGLRIEHVTSAWVRTESRWSCDVCREPAQGELPL